jgi:hypothetical protein
MAHPTPYFIYTTWKVRAIARKNSSIRQGLGNSKGKCETEERYLPEEKCFL